MAFPRIKEAEKPSFASEGSLFPVSELKQFTYCPRIPYFVRDLGLRPRASFLMKHGALEEEYFDKRQRRHSLSRFGLTDAKRWKDVSLYSRRLGLTGKADLILEGAREVIVADFKSGRSGPWQNHKIQIAAYGLLAEEKFGKPCEKGFLYYSSDKMWVEVQMDERLRKAIFALMEEMKGTLNQGILPDPTPFENRCPGCEFLNFCGDRR